MIKNPDAPASSRQLMKLKTLTGKDWREADLTMQEASDYIDQFEAKGGIVAFESEQIDRFVIPTGQKPFTEPQVTLVTGAQRSGKSNTAVGRVVDASDNTAVEKFCLDEYGMKVVCKGYDRKSRIARIKVGQQKRYIRIPEWYKLQSPLKVFANFHLFGIPYVYCPSFRFIVDGLKSGLITDGYLLMDEYYMGGYNRESMRSLPRALAQLSNQYAKGMLRVTMIAPIANQLDWTARLAPTEVIETEFNKYTKIVTCRIKKKGVPGVKLVSYYAPRYWKHYWTNEKINQ